MAQDDGRLEGGLKKRPEPGFGDWFLRIASCDAVGDVEEKGTITFTCVCDHCKMLSVADFLWWVTAKH